MTAVPGDFELTMDELRAVTRFVADCAERVLPTFEAAHPDDRRPRDAIDAAWTFANGAARTRLQRVTSLEAHRAAKEASSEIARLASRCAGDAASAAYLHPLARANQVGHILRAAASAARIAELQSGDDPRVGDRAIEELRQRATPVVIEVLRRYPRPSATPNRVSQLMAALDASLRASRPDHITQLDAGPPAHYLDANPMVESDHPDVIALGRRLRQGQPNDADFAHTAFEWVRDNIAHSYDAQDPRVTLTASQVLREGVGLCYAKSNLLAAILRSQGIPAGLCYQRLGNPVEGHVLHGLVAVHLDGARHRQDPRGNKPGVDAQFSLTGERLAFPINESQGERDYPRLYEAPAPEVVQALTNADDILTCALPSDLR